MIVDSRKQIQYLQGSGFDDTDIITLPANYEFSPPSTRKFNCDAMIRDSRKEVEFVFLSLESVKFKHQLVYMVINVMDSLEHVIFIFVMNNLIQLQMQLML